MGSPGSGKTTFFLQICHLLENDIYSKEINIFKGIIYAFILACVYNCSIFLLKNNIGFYKSENLTNAQEIMEYIKGNSLTPKKALEFYNQELHKKVKFIINDYHFQQVLSNHIQEFRDYDKIQ